MALGAASWKQPGRVYSISLAGEPDVDYVDELCNLEFD